jgi:hypothetical protein
MSRTYDLLYETAGGGRWTCGVFQSLSSCDRSESTTQLASEDHGRNLKGLQ